MKTKLHKTFQAIAVLSLLLAFRVVPVSAATTSIVGRTNGTSCNSGGYFTPSSVTITSGDTITFSVPSNDPYLYGEEIHGFPQGSFTVARGGTFTTDPITSNVQFNGTWPNTSCPKGGGTVTVNAATPPPSSPPSSGSTGGSSSGGSTSRSSSSSKSTATTPNKSATTNTSTMPSTLPATTSSPINGSNTSTAPRSASAAPEATNHLSTTSAKATENPGLKNTATLGGGGLAVIVIGAFITWRMLARRRLSKPVEQPVTVQPAPIEPYAAQIPPVEVQSPPNTAESPTGQNSANSQDEPR